MAKRPIKRGNFTARKTTIKQRLDNQTDQEWMAKRIEKLKQDAEREKAANTPAKEEKDGKD